MIKRNKIFLFIYIILSSAITTVKAGDKPNYLNFIQNKGQWNPKVVYQSDFRGGRVFLESNAFTYLFYPSDGLTKLHPHPGGPSASAATLTFQAVRMEFINSNENILTDGSGKKEFYQNYYTGKTPSKWATSVPVYDEVKYHELYPGISMDVFGSANDVRYDLLLNPKADVSSIHFRFTGQNKLSLKNNDLIIHTEVGEIIQQAPYAYQEINGKRNKIDCKYTLKENIVGIELTEKYDHSKPLVIDPTLTFATYTGSTADNWGMSATYDAVGDGYTSGVCFNPGYPITTGAIQQTFAGGVVNNVNNYMGYDMVVSKFNASGSSLLFSTYLGGSDDESPQSLIVDNNNNLLLLGRTWSVDFPVTAGSYDVSLNGGTDIVVVKFNATGTALLGSTFVGGSNDDGVNFNGTEAILGSLKYNYADDGRGDIMIDNTNNIYVASCTSSSDFPTSTGCIQATNHGMQDACIFKLDPALSSLAWSTYLGGAFNDAAYNLVLDNFNNVYVTGGTESSDFITTPGVIHTTYGGNIDGFLTHISAGGTGVLESTYLGTPAYDQSYFVQTDKFNNVYVYGQTGGAYPVTAGVYSNANGGQFIHKLNATLSSTVFSTVFGTGKGTPDIAPSAFLVDICQNIYIAGWGGVLFGLNIFTSTTNGLPITPNAFQMTTDGSDFYFMVLQKDATALLYGSYFGGPNSEEHVDGGTSRFDKAGVAYQAICEGCGMHSDMPVSPGAWSPTNNSNNCNNALVKFTFDLRQTIAAFSPAMVSSGCAPYLVNFQNNSINAVLYNWDFGDGATSTLQNPSHTYIAPGNYTVTLISTDSTTCNMVDTAYSTVHVAPPIILNPMLPAAICSGDSVQLHAVSLSALSFQWSPATGLSNTAISNPLASPVMATIYTVTVQDSFCTTSGTVLVGILPPVVLNPMPAITICTGTTAQLNAVSPTATSFQWSPANTLNNSTISNPIASPLVTGYYTVTVSDGTCTEHDSVLVKVVPPLVPDPMPSLKLCQGDSVQLLVIANGALSFQWAPVNGLSNATIPNPYANPVVNTTYTVTVQDSFCIGTTSVLVSLYPAVTLNPMSAVNICIGDSIQLNAVSPTATSFQWTPATALSSTIISNPYASPSAPILYTITAKDSFCTANTSINVQVFSNTTNLIPNPASFCEGNTVTLTTINTYSFYQWSNGLTTPSIQVNQAGMYFVNTIDQHGCKDSDSTLVSVFSPAIVTPDSVAICYGQSITILTTQGNYNYNWNPSNTLNNGSIYNPLAHPTESTTYSVSISNGPCISNSTYTVTVIPSPKINLLADSIMILPGESVLLFVMADSTCHWSPSMYLTCTYCSSTIATPDTNITYYVGTTNSSGCPSLDSVRIFIEPSFYIPNSFTPNKDGRNDIFRPEYTGYTEINAFIFNRWGELIYQWKTLEGGWDGTCKGTASQEDVFVYSMTATDYLGKTIQRTGTVTLVR